mmetsp:Transcript_13007/g.30755  ORF Transcript_13007/g.30755 Transcript_13007/m.30755 type:complete len:283 (+) Transcript_13007:231-1079(+)
MIQAISPATSSELVPPAAPLVNRHSSLCPVQLPLRPPIVPVGHRVVQRLGVIPNDDVADAPRVEVREARSRRVREEHLQQPPTRFGGLVLETHDLHVGRADVQHGTAVHGVHVEDRVASVGEARQVVLGAPREVGDVPDRALDGRPRGALDERPRERGERRSEVSEAGLAARRGGLLGVQDAEDVVPRADPELAVLVPVRPELRVRSLPRPVGPEVRDPLYRRVKRLGILPFEGAGEDDDLPEPRRELDLLRPRQVLARYHHDAVGPDRVDQVGRLVVRDLA